LAWPFIIVYFLLGTIFFFIFASYGLVCRTVVENNFHEVTSVLDNANNPIPGVDTYNFVGKNLYGLSDVFNDVNGWTSEPKILFGDVVNSCFKGETLSSALALDLQPTFFINGSIDDIDFTSAINFDNLVPSTVNELKDSIDQQDDLRQRAGVGSDTIFNIDDFNEKAQNAREIIENYTLAVNETDAAANGRTGVLTLMNTTLDKLNEATQDVNDNFVGENSATEASFDALNTSYSIIRDELDFITSSAFTTDLEAKAERLVEDSKTILTDNLGAGTAGALTELQENLLPCQPAMQLAQDMIQLPCDLQPVLDTLWFTIIWSGVFMIVIMFLLTCLSRHFQDVIEFKAVDLNMVSSIPGLSTGSLSYSQGNESIHSTVHNSRMSSHEEIEATLDEDELPFYENKSPQPTPRASKRSSMALSRVNSSFSNAVSESNYRNSFASTAPILDSHGEMVDLEPEDFQKDDYTMSNY